MASGNSGAVGRAVWMYSSLLILLSAIALVVVMIQRQRGLDYPANTFLFDPDFRFSDFSIFASQFRATAGPREFFAKFGDSFNYGAPGFVALFWLSKWVAYPWFLMHAVVVATTVTGGIWLGSHLRGAGFAWAILLTAVLSYPLLYLMDRGNFEGMIWPAVVISIWFYAKRAYYAAAAIFGLVAAIKFFPALLLLLLMRKGRWREAVFGLAVFAASTYWSLLWIGPTPLEAQRHLSNAMADFKEWYTLYWDHKEIGFDHSLFAVWKQILRQWFGDTENVPAILARTATGYAILTAGGFLLLYWFRLRGLPVANCVLACLVAMVTFPYVSYDYTLVHLYIGWGMLLVVLAKGETKLTFPQMLLFLIPFAVIFTPQSYLLWDDFGFGGQVKAGALLCLFCASLRYPLPLEQLDGDL